MKDLLDKISSYNIFNFLLPGILFVALAKEFTHFDFQQPDILTGAFVYYFLGMIISRFGSLVIEPILKKTSFLKFADYKSFVVACKKDEKIELLSEVNNTYRTVCSLLILLMIVKLYDFIASKYAISDDMTSILIIILLLIMFLFSHRKQTSYIFKRIIANS